MLNKLIWSTILLLTTQQSYAFFCPTNFNQIDAGNTIAQVTALCGEPEKKEEKTLEPFLPQEWVYYVPQTVSANSLQQVQGTLKVSFSFDKDKKSINISVNGLGVGATSVCGPNLELGDDPDKVKAACGDPTFINKQEQTADQAKKEDMKTTTFIYSNPPAKLIFENGKLVKQE